MSFKSISAVTWLQKRVEFDTKYLPELLGKKVYEHMVILYKDELESYEDDSVDENNSVARHDMLDWFLAVKVWNHFTDLVNHVGDFSLKVDENSSPIVVEFAERIIKTIKTGYELDNPYVNPAKPIEDTKNIAHFPSNTILWLKDKVAGDAGYLEAVMSKIHIDALEQKFEVKLRKHAKNTKEYRILLADLLWKDLNEMSERSNSDENKKFALNRVNYLRNSWKKEKETFHKETTGTKVPTLVEETKSFPPNVIIWLKNKAVNEPEFLETTLSKKNVDTIEGKYVEQLKSYSGDERKREFAKKVWNELRNLSNNSQDNTTKNFASGVIEYFTNLWKEEKQEYLNQMEKLGHGQLNAPVPVINMLPPVTDILHPLIDPNTDNFINTRSFAEIVTLLQLEDDTFKY